MEKVRLLLLNLYFYPLFFIFSAIGITVLTVFVSVLSIILTHRQTMKRFRRAISWYGRLIISLPFPFIRVRYEVSTQTDALKDKGPYIFVCNHRASSDAFLMCLLPCEVVQVVNTWPFRIPVLGPFARLSGYLDVNNLPPEQFFAKALKLLEDGVSVIFFPEGTRSGSRKIQNFHGSAFRLALLSKTPIVPLCISGNENIPPRGSIILRTGMIRVRRLPAIHWEEYKDMTVFSLKNMVRRLMLKELSLMDGCA
jgi:1-acyl-sn-glycerol-3-phosphate acyltransferase